MTAMSSGGKLEELFQAGAPALPDAYDAVRQFTVGLTVPLSPEDQTVQSMPDVSPTKWHLAHTTWFFEEFLLERFGAGYERFHPDFAFLFNSYYEAIGPRHARHRRGVLTRPGVHEILTYREFVDEKVSSLLAAERPGRSTSPSPTESALVAIVELGLHHEQQHQELLLMDIKHVLSCNPLDPAYEVAATRIPSVERSLGWIVDEGGEAEVGHGGSGFAFDNEGPRHRTWVEPFAIADRPVTSGEWLAFIDDGGYQRPEFWLSDGWATVQAEGWDAPLYWSRDGAGDWTTFTLYGRAPVDPHAPVSHVSYYEAEAFAHWAGHRLPTEAEWELGVGPLVERDKRIHGLEPLSRSSDESPGGSGEVWEWTASAYLPYPGYRPPAGAIGEYNGKFMVNQHVLRGSASITSPGHLRATYRNFFPPVSRWAYSGLRLARSV